jgi:outer membrane lipoprotein-sorting protein
MTVFLLLVGCGKDEKFFESEIIEESTQESVNSEENVEENEDKTEEEVDLSEVKGKVKITYDASLTGEALMKSIDFEGGSDFFDSLAFKSTSETKMDTGSGIQTTIMEVVHNKNGDLYMKSISPLGVGITISKEVDGIEMTYSYMEGEATGYLMKDSMEDEMYDDFLEDGLGLYDPEYEILLEARVDQLLGKEIIYYELKSEDTITKNWFSPELGGPVKTEVWVGDLLVMENNLTSYEVLSKVDDKYFEAPSDVTFHELDY